MMKSQVLSLTSLSESENLTFIIHNICHRVYALGGKELSFPWLLYCQRCWKNHRPMYTFWLKGISIYIVTYAHVNETRVRTHPIHQSMMCMHYDKTHSRSSIEANYSRSSIEAHFIGTSRERMPYISWLALILDSFMIYNNGSGLELHTNGSFGIRGELIARKTIEYLRFSNR